jgi:hypothetical protein
MGHERIEGKALFISPRELAGSVSRTSRCARRREAFFVEALSRSSVTFSHA